MQIHYVLTDTDFVDARGLNSSEYQLVYGLFRCCQNSSKDQLEVDLYNLIASLCNEYPEPLLRESLIATWKNTLHGMQQRASELAKKYKDTIEIGFFSPFLGGNVADYKTLDYAITFVSGLLSRLSVDSKGCFDIHASNSFKYPLPPLKDLFADLRAHYEESVLEGDIRKEKAEDVIEGICWEEYKRNLCAYDMNDLNDEAVDYYSTYFFWSNYLDINKKDATETENDDNIAPKELSMKLKTGALMYMLEAFGVRDKEQIRRIAHFAFKHGKEQYFAKTNSNDTIYSYIHNPNNQLWKLANAIEGILIEYNVDIPEGLKELQAYKPTL